VTINTFLVTFYIEMPSDSKQIVKFEFSRHIHALIREKEERRKEGMKWSEKLQETIILDKLPNELLLIIFSDLNKSDIAQCIQAFNGCTRPFSVLKEFMWGINGPVKYQVRYVTHCDVFDNDEYARSVDRNVKLILASPSNHGEEHEIIKVINDGYGGFIYGTNGKPESGRTRIFTTSTLPMTDAWPSVVVHTLGLTPIYQVDFGLFDLIIVERDLFEEFFSLFPLDKTWVQNDPKVWFKTKCWYDKGTETDFLKCLISKLNFSELKVTPGRHYGFISKNNFYCEKWMSGESFWLETTLEFEREKRIADGNTWS